MVAMDLGADNGFFYAGQIMHFSSPFTVFLIYHKQPLMGHCVIVSMGYECYLFAVSLSAIKWDIPVAVVIPRTNGISH